MQTTSALYNQILTDINHTFEVKLEIGGVVYGMDSLLSLETNCKVFDNKPTIGGVYSATCQFSFLGNGQNIPRMAQCVPFFRITNGTDTSEWIKKGVFYIDTREVTKNGDGLDVFSAFCYDGMMMANSDYSTSELEWPATDADVVDEICSQIGVLQDPRNASIITEAYSIPFPVQYTKRDVLSYIAAMYGANWIMTDEGKLRLIPMTGNADSIDIGKSLMGLNVSPTRPPFTQVVLMASDTDTVISGNNQSNVIDAYCPYATQSIADRVYSILSTWSYHPFTADGVWANPALELGDQLTANENTATVFSRDLHFGSGMTMALSAPVEEYIDHEYAFESPADRRYTRTIGGLKTRIEMNSDGIALAVANTPIVNLLPSAYYREIVSSNPYVRSGITWTVNPDGSITATGTATSDSTYAVSGSMLTEMVPVITIDPDKKYYLTGCPANGSSSTYRMGIRTTPEGTMPSTSTGGVQYEYGNGLQVTEDRKYAFVYCQVLRGYTCPAGGLTFYPMLEVGETAHAYVSTHEGSGGLTERLYDTEATVSLNSDKIALVVSETLEGYEVNAASIVASINDSGSSVIISADKVDLEGYVTFSNLKTGGRNLFKGSQYMNGTNSASTGTWATSKFFRSGTGTVAWNQALSDSPVPDCEHGAILTATSANTRIGFGQAAYPSLQEGPYTISFWAKGTAGDKVHTFPYYASASDQGTYSDPVEISATGVWQRFSFTHKDNTPGNIGGAYRIGYILFESATAGHTVTICAPKFEYGNVATSWTPAPEDSPTFVDLATPGQTIIDGGNITTNTITADKINLTDLFSQNITATNFNITGGSVNITTDSSHYSYIKIRSVNRESAISATSFEVVMNENGDVVSGVNVNGDGTISILQNDGELDSLFHRSKWTYNIAPVGLSFTQDSFLKIFSIGSLRILVADLTFVSGASFGENTAYTIATLDNRCIPYRIPFSVTISDTKGDSTCVLTVNKYPAKTVTLFRETGSNAFANGSRLYAVVPMIGPVQWEIPDPDIWEN